jgi:uncharacterized protein
VTSRRDSWLDREAGPVVRPYAVTKGRTGAAASIGLIDMVIAVADVPSAGRPRFWFMWDELALGALGAVVLADTRRLADCFASVDYFEQHSTPFVVAVNCFDDAPHYEPDDVRIALDLAPEVPVVLCDARQRDSVKRVLIALVRYVISLSATDLESAGVS